MSCDVIQHKRLKLEAGKMRAEITRLHTEARESSVQVEQKAIEAVAVYFERERNPYLEQDEWSGKEIAQEIRNLSPKPTQTCKAHGAYSSGHALCTCNQLDKLKLECEQLKTVRCNKCGDDGIDIPTSGRRYQAKRDEKCWRKCGGQYVDEVAYLNQNIDILAKVLEPLRNIADAYDKNALDNEARKFWGKNDEHQNETMPKEIELYSGRGGKQLLTLQDCLDARAVLLRVKA
jgi:hypothetical protein